MANDITNVIHVKEKTEEFKKALINEQGLVDFNKVIERPKDLLIEKGSLSYNPKLGTFTYNESSIGYKQDEVQHRVQAILEKLYKEELTQEKYVEEVLSETIDNPYWSKPEDTYEDMLKRSVICKAQGYYNIQKHGFMDWCDWSRKNWGTKWNAYGDSVVVIENNNGLFIAFETVWCTPVGVFSKLSERFDFTVAFADSDNRGCNLGLINACKGKELEVNYFDDMEEDYSCDDCYYLCDKICEVAYEDDEELLYKLSAERIEELDRMIKPYLT